MTGAGNRIVTGDYYDKYASENVIERRFVNGFLAALDGFFARVGQADSVLEIGCGEGAMLQRAREKFPDADIVATDIDLDLLKGWNHAFSGFLAVNALPDVCFRDETFDLVLLLEVLEHVVQPEQALEAVKGATKKYAIVSVPSEPIWRVCNMARLKYLKHLGNTPGHISHFSARSFKTILERHFKRVDIIKPFPWLMALCEKDEN